MKWAFSGHVNLANERIKRSDSSRQRRTARTILERFDRQPGVILADEVGLGKTYVALAVATSVALDPTTSDPVVVMVPTSVAGKWPREWAFFERYCLKGARPMRVTENTIRSGVEFLRLLDDPVDRRPDIIFLTHGALTRSLTDPLIRLAIVRRALLRPSLRRQRSTFPRWAHRVIPRGWELSESRVRVLMDTPPSGWRREWRNLTGRDSGDDPVPAALIDALNRVDLAPLIEACHGLPLRSSPFLEARLSEVRGALTYAVENAWRQTLREADLRLPLLVLDEAHHAKNSNTGLARLFASPADREEADLRRGPLARAFDRMLFLTATPLQLAHRELIEVLRRFEGIRWDDQAERSAYAARLEKLEMALDRAQAASLRLDRAWNSLKTEDIEDAPDDWWEADLAKLPDRLREAAGHIAEVRSRTESAERHLRPLVIRHSRPDLDERRSVRCGSEILDTHPTQPGGLQIDGAAVLPFLLAARAQALVAAGGAGEVIGGRALFAEGLASSFEAYAHTRESADGSSVADEMEIDGVGENSSELRWYLGQIRRALPEGDHGLWCTHPKVSATVQRAMELWLQDSKVLVFCFYRRTGEALRQHLTRVVDEWVVRNAAIQLGWRQADPELVRDELRRRSDRFFDPDAPVTKVAREAIHRELAACGIDDEDGAWVGVVLKFLRTPSFLVRHVGLERKGVEGLERALHEPDEAGITLTERLRSFATYIEKRDPDERVELHRELDSLESGVRERQGKLVVPNVRLANGEVDVALRERLMMAFNAPFFPEVLIASSVMAEGVDLHLNCRHVIHHDLAWNPSVIEQRTGRLDRLGSLAETAKQPVVVYEPYLEATQDEKMFKVMKDRERWFNVVMGSRLELDEWSTERLSKRVSLPDALANDLTLDLSLA